MKFLRNLKKFRWSIYNSERCFSLDRKILSATGYWPTKSLKNFKFLTSLILTTIFIFLAKLNYLRIVLEASNPKQVVVVTAEIITVIGFGWLSCLLLTTEKAIKSFLENFEIEWEMSKCDENKNTYNFFN